MIIIKKDRSASIPQAERLIGFENDHLVEKRLFYVADPSLNGFTFKLDVENTSDIVSLTPVTDGAVDILSQESGETPSGVLLQWDITRGVLEDGGIITVQLRAFDAEGKHIWHSEKMDFIAGASVKATEEASSEATLTEFEQIETRVSKALADVDAVKGDITDKYNEIIQLGDAYQEAMENVGMLGQETAAHYADKDNPHEVTAEQVGAYKKSEIDAKTAPLEEHLKNFSNPHEVTAEQVGAYKKSEIDQKTAPLEEHLKNFSNPHEVTAEQVGTYSKAEIDAQAEVTAKALEDANSEIAAKLSKTTESYPTDRVYGVSMAGEQVMLEAHRDSNNVGGIPVYDNNGVIKTGTPVKDTDSVNKKYVDDKAAGKLDKVKSDFLLYPGVYTAADTDGTPYLLTATSDLGYIGKTGGYIATYDGGELKTGTPTADDSAANKAYVDEKVKVSKDYKLLATLNFTENASTFTVTTLNGQAIALKSMAVIMNRIGDGESANGYITPIFTTKDATGVSRDIKGGYFYGIGANGNSWYTRAEISGDFIDVEGVCMSPGTNAQISNGCMSDKFSRVMSWRNLSDDFLPITQITGFKITASGNCITNGSTMWIYGKEE